MSKDIARSLENCLKCSICHTKCPVVAHKFSFPGPKQLGPELERLRLSGKKEVVDIDYNLSLCTNCKRCDLACPHDVKPSYYNMKNKAKLQKKTLESIRDWILAHNGLTGKVFSIFPKFSNFLLGSSLSKVGMKFLGIANRKFPKYKKLNYITENENKAKKVLYYPGCYARFNEPEIIKATVEVLKKCDYEVKIAFLDCCGTPLVGNGYLKEAKNTAIKNAKVLLEYINKGYKVVTTCSSCGLTLKEEYNNFLNTEDADILSHNVWDLFELLMEEDLKFNEREKLKSAYYHTPCHLLVQGIGKPAASILKENVIDEMIIEDSYCCGNAGTYGYKKEKYDLAKEIGSSLFKDIKDSKTDLVITDCGPCKLQIEEQTKVSVKHPVLVLRDYLK